MKVSIVIPAFNEENSVEILFSFLKQAIEKIDGIDDYEYIFVDDGSRDSTYNKLASLSKNNKKVSIIKLDKNTGLSNALHVGFEASHNEIIVTMDADLENDPSDIPGMLEKLNEGYDCICGWRHQRKGPFIKKISSNIANSVRRFILGDNFNDITSPLKVLRRECLKDITFFNGYHRFLPYFIQLKGYKVLEYKISHNPRKFGKSKYGVFNRIFKVLIDVCYVRFILLPKEFKEGK